jgi:hypothetical protein
LKGNNKHALIRKFNTTWNEKKIIITQFLYNIKKVTSIYFLFAVWKKNSIREKKKHLQRKKKQNWKYLKRKKKLVIYVLSVALLCAINDTTIKNTLFEDGDSANTFLAFNLTQTFLLSIFLFLLLTRCGARTNMLVIILLSNDYLLKYFLKNILR